MSSEPAVQREVEEVVATLNEQGVRRYIPDSLTPYGSTQRHRSWRVADDQGTAVWLKIEASPSPVAGVVREARMLLALADGPPVPTLVASGTTRRGTPYLVTDEVRGARVQVARPRATETIDSLAVSLLDLHQRADEVSDAAFVGDDIWGRHPNLAVLLTQATRDEPELQVLVGRILKKLETQAVSAPPVLIHGSFDPDNVLIAKDLTAWLLDLEATRVGPAALDIAAMTGALLELGDPEAAARWLDVIGRSRTADCSHLAIAGYLVLRVGLRTRAGAISQRAAADCLSLAEQLLS